MDSAVQALTRLGAPCGDGDHRAPSPPREHVPLVEIHVLGPLRAFRADGTEVGAHEWRTGKTADLLRLLALHVGRPVEVSALLERLWPDVDEARGRASLRTAASQIRRALHRDCIHRRHGGLVLDDAWVDASAFETLAAAVPDSIRAGDHARVVELAQHAEAIYVDDFHACDDYSSWAQEVRETLVARRRALLSDAAESAVRHGRCREGAELAQLAIRTDPLSEGPHRALMLAYARLGETEKALRTFEQLRSALADELGVDPSPSTCAVHLQVLRGEAGPHAVAEGQLPAVPRPREESSVAATGSSRGGSEQPGGIGLAEHLRDFLSLLGPLSSVEVRVLAIDHRGHRVEMVADVGRPSPRLMAPFDVRTSAGVEVDVAG